MSALIHIWGLFLLALKILGFIILGLTIAAVVVVVVIFIFFLIARENGENPFQ